MYANIFPVSTCLDGSGEIVFRYRKFSKTIPKESVMPVIKVNLDDEEYAPISRLAQELHLQPEDVAYAALNELMLRADEPAIRADIAHAHSWRQANLPQWGDSARSVHAYEGKADDPPTEHR